MSISKIFAGAAALTLAAAPIAVSAEEAISRDAAAVTGESELGGDLPWYVGPLIIAAGLAAIIIIAVEDDEPPVSV